MTGHNRIPTKQPWWHISDELFYGLAEIVTLEALIVVLVTLVIA